MKNSKLLIIILTMVMIAANTAFAGNTQTVTVSCTIPLVPGLNAPITEEDAVVSDEPVNEVYEHAMIVSQEEPVIIEEETISEDSTLYTFCLK